MARNLFHDGTGFALIFGRFFDFIERPAAGYDLGHFVVPSDPLAEVFLGYDLLLRCHAATVTQIPDFCNFGGTDVKAIRCIMDL